MSVKSTTAQRSDTTRETKREIWDLRWVREPLQSRSEKTRAQLLDATEKLLTSEGVDELTIAKISGLAGCSVGSFYHHFQDKTAVLYAVLDRASKERILTVEKGFNPERWTDRPLIEILEGYVKYRLKLGKRAAGFMLARRRLSMSDPHIDSQSRKASKEVNNLILNLLQTRSQEVQLPDPKLAFQIVLEMLDAMLERRFFAKLPGGRSHLPRLNEDVFVAELMQMAKSYLEIQD